MLPTECKRALNEKIYEDEKKVVFWVSTNKDLKYVVWENEANNIQ